MRFDRLSLAIGMIAAAAAGLPAIAATPAIETAVKTRQANYKAIGKNFKGLNDQLKSGAPDAAAVRAAAAEIARLAPQQVKLFPAGSGPDSGLKMEAKAEIWTDNATFVKLNQDFVARANALNSVAAAGNMAAVGGAAKDLGGTCKACHDRFKAE